MTESDINAKKPIVAFRQWFDYHLVRTKPITTTCNWADFFNKNALVIKYVRFVLFSFQIRKIYRKGPFDSAELRSIFSNILSEVQDYVDEDVLYAIRLPTFKDEKKKEVTESMVHTGVAFTNLECLDNDLMTALSSLMSLVTKHGTVGGKMTEKVHDGCEKLIQVRRYNKLL